MSIYLKTFTDFLDSGRWLNFLFLLMGIMLLTIMVKIQFGHNRVDFKDYLLDDNGKASPTKGFMIGCFLTTTWGFVVLVDKGLISEWYFNGYIFLWSANRLATKYLDGKVGQFIPAAPTSVSVTANPGDTVNVQTGSK